MGSIATKNANGKATPATIPTALLYTRVSKDEMAREGLSLDAQLANCRRYAAGQGWPIGDEYQDVLSGTRDDRPHYQQLLADIRRLRAEGRNVVVVVGWLHRLGRRVLERVRCREEMKALGVPLHSIAEGGEVSDLVANILASVAEEEVRQLSERVRAVFAHINASGWTKVGPCPWGYVWRAATAEERATGAPRSVLDVNPATATYARESFERVAAGRSIHSVARWLQALPASVRQGKPFSYNATRKLLLSPTYAARTPRGTPGRWPAIVDATTWERAQEKTAGHAHMPKQATGRYLATGLLRCPRCGGRMRGQVAEVKRGLYHVYRCCGVRDKGADAADRACQFSAALPRVDAALLSEVTALVASAASASASMRAALRRAWQALQQAENGSDQAQRVRQLERERDRAKQRLTKAALLLVDGKIDKEGYDALRDEVHADMTAAEAELARLGTVEPVVTLPDLDAVLRLAGGWAEALRSADVPGQRAVLGVLIDRVVPIRDGWRKYRLEIAWTPLGEALRQVATDAVAP